MSLLLLFQPAHAVEEVIIVEPPVVEVFQARPLVKVISDSMGIGDQPPQSIKWY